MADLAQRTAQELLARPAEDLAEAIVHPEPAPRRVEVGHADGGVLEGAPEETLQPVSLLDDLVDAPRVADREADERRHREQREDGDGRSAAPVAGVDSDAGDQTAGQRDPKQRRQRLAQLVPPDRASGQHTRVRVGASRCRLRRRRAATSRHTASGAKRASKSNHRSWIADVTGITRTALRDGTNAAKQMASEVGPAPSGLRRPFEFRLGE
jgi:hypothetical protein